MRLVRDVSFGIVFAFIGSIYPPVNAADSAIVVALQSGRKFAGEVDPASNAEQLVLKTTTGGITVQRPIRWERIVEVTMDGKRVEVGTLRQDARGRGQGTGDGGQRSLLRKIELRGAVVPASAELEAALDEVPAQVTMVNFDPYIANWDADVETDGLMIDIVPLDGEGFLIPCNGTLTVELFG